MIASSAVQPIYARILVCLALGLVACGSKASARLRGHWTGARVVGVPAGPNLEAANKFARGMELEVREKDLTMSFVKDGKRESYSAAFQIAKESGNSVVVTSAFDATGQTLELSEDGSLSWAMSRDATIVFEKRASQ